MLRRWGRPAGALAASALRPCLRAFSSGSADSTQLIVEQLLQIVGSKRDIDDYVKFYGGRKDRCAVIKVGGEVIRDELDTFACALTVLHSVGRAADERGDGREEHRAAVPGRHARHGRRHAGGGAAGLPRDESQTLRAPRAARHARPPPRGRHLPGPVSETCVAEQKDEQYGFVGDITAVRSDQVDAALQAGYLPVVAPLAESYSGQILNVNADVAAREMAISLKPLKTIFINAKGGWVEEDGTKLRSIDMTHSYEEMASRDYTGRQGTLLKLNELKLILDSLPPPSSISLTSASGLVRELFTHRGAGTVVWHGDPIKRYGPGEFGDLDLPAIEKLLHESFGQQLFENFTQKGQLRPGYLQGLIDSGRLGAVYLSNSLQTAAIVEQAEGGVPYLCKFAVTEAAMGLGSGDALWNILRKDYDALYWRSHSQSHDINHWFFEQADGVEKVAAAGEVQPPWTVFWYGVDDHGQQQACVQDAASRQRSYFAQNEVV